MAKVIRDLSPLAGATMICLLSVLFSVARAAPGDHVSSEQLSAMISAVRAETDVNRQELAARKIPPLVTGADLSGVDTKTLDELASLFESPNDAVRLWVAAALGSFGGRATFAVPKLLAVLPEVDCATLRGLNSAGAIRLAVERITGESPPPTDCPRYWKEKEGA